MFPANNLEKYFNELNEQNWTLIPVDFVLATKLQISAECKFKANQFKTANITVAEAGSAVIRSDYIFWLDAKDATLTDNDQTALAQLEFLTNALKNFFRISLTEFECHFAVYKPGSFYKKHRDTTLQDNKRVFSFVVYLNPEWSPTDGGELVGYKDNRTLFQISPTIGKMILFKSDIEHEVLIAARTRYTLTGWIRR